MAFGEIKETRASCPYCGNNPIAGHFLYWYFESSNVFLAPLRRFLLYNGFSRLCKTMAERLNLSWRFARLAKAFGIIKFRDDINLCKAPRAKVLWEEALRRNVKMSELLLFNRPFDCYVAQKEEFLISNSEFLNKSQITNPKSRIVFSGLPRPKDYDDSALDWMDDKQLFKEKLIEYNLPVPRGGAVWNFRQAKEIFLEIQNTPPLSPPALEGEREVKPVIVKPRAGSRGRHSSTFVSSEKDLKLAFKIAKQLCFWVVIEEQLTGPVYRATLINYELCGVLRGDPPQITGDGIHSIDWLIKTKNSRPHLGVKDIVMDEEMERFLQRQLFLSSPGEGRAGRGRTDANREVLSFDYIPEIGKTINLSEKIGVNYGGSSSEDFDICHHDNKELFIRTAKTIADPIVGFDFIIPDITKSWRRQKCGFIEANSLPFINLHHDPLFGKPRNVAKKVWDMMDW